MEQAWLMAEDGIVTAIGTDADWPGIDGWNGLEVLDATGRYVLPGWRDPHSHAVFATSREGEFVDRINSLGYQKIAAKGGGVLNSAMRLRAMDEDELFLHARRRVKQLMRLGTVAIEIKSGYGLDLDSKLKMLRVARRVKESLPLQVRTTLLAAHSVPPEFKENRTGYMDLVVAEMIPRVAAESLAQYVDCLCETAYFMVAEMERVLAAGAHGICMANVDGGGLRNAIPRESNALVAVPADSADAFTKGFRELADAIVAEYRTTDPELKIGATAADAPVKVMAAKDQRGFLRAVQATPNGIFRMSPDVKDLVQTSNNLARVQLKDGQYTAMCLTRSSVESEKMDEADGIRAAWELAGGSVQYTGGYPGWTPRPDSKIVKLMAALYKERFGEEAHVLACHAGLECGITGRNYPGMEMISFGPTIRGAHSPDEKANIPSVRKFWGYLLETLEKL
jgi:hypothetical protein